MNVWAEIKAAWKAAAMAVRDSAALRMDHDRLEKDVRDLTRALCRAEERLELLEQNRSRVAVSGAEADSAGFDFSESFDTGGK